VVGRRMCGVEGGRWVWAFTGGGQGYGCGPELGGGGEDGQSSLGDLGDEAVGQFYAGEEGLGYGSLDAAFAQSLENLVERGKGGGLVEKKREHQGLRFLRSFFR
jgi:hypothetical protein